MDELFEAVLLVRDRDEARRFFDDLCTVQELQAMAQRFAVARLLSEGEIFARIREETGASTATISRVNRALRYGSDGYRLILARVKEESRSG